MELKVTEGFIFNHFSNLINLNPSVSIVYEDLE